MLSMAICLKRAVLTEQWSFATGSQRREFFYVIIIRCPNWAAIKRMGSCSRIRASL